MLALLSARVLEKALAFDVVVRIASAFSAISLSARSSTPPAFAERVATLSIISCTLSG